ELKKYGLFLVPVGELEEWLAGYHVEASKSDKRAWANAAAQTIQRMGKHEGDVWAFVAEVCQYLSGEAEIAKTEAASAGDHKEENLAAKSNGDLLEASEIGAS